MNPKITSIIVGLALLGGLLAVKSYRVWVTDLVPAATSGHAVTPGNPVDTAGDKVDYLTRRVAAKSTYQEIATRNLFSPERTEYKATEADDDQGAIQEIVKVDGKQIILYGVVLMAERQAALISNPENKNQKNATRWIGPDDRVGDLTVAEIKKESILLVGNGRRYRVPLYDKENDAKKRRVAPAKGSQTSASDAPRPTVVSTQKPSSPKAPETAAPTNITKTDDGTEVIRTPFGNIKRKK